MSTPVLDVARPRLRLPRRPPGALRRRPARPPGRAGRAARSQRRRQDHPGAAPQRHPHRPGPASVSGQRAAGREGEPAGDPAPRRHRLPGPRRPALHGHACAPTSPSARPTSASRAPRSRRRVHGRARAGRDGRLRRPPAAPPLLRPASPGRGGHRAGDGARDPGARRAVVQPRPGLAPRARRHPALARRDGADGHPRPALRPRAVPALGGAQRRPRRRRRGDVRRAHRRRPDARATASSCPSASIRGPRCRSRPRAIDSLPREQRSQTTSPARSRRPASDSPSPSTSCSTGRPPRRSSSREIGRDQGVTTSTPTTGEPRTDNILKTVGGVVGTIVLFVVVAARALTPS